MLRLLPWFLLIKLTLTSKMSGKELKNLFTDLKSDLDADKRYWVRNDAKLRAVVTAKSYDEFRDYVEAAHLSSLSRNDWNKKAKTNWNKAQF